jgi:hypothetical protein
MIQYKFAEYLNLLYIIDVSEEEVRNKMGTDLVLLAEQVSFNPKKENGKKCGLEININKSWY